MKQAFPFAAVVLGGLVFAGQAYAATCESLSTLSLPNTKVTAAQSVAPGAFTPGGPGGRGGGAFAALPAFCRVAATLTPSSDSDIKIEVWLPTAGWNGKLQAVGNGAWQGSIAYPALAEGLGRGYVTTSTDTGHVGGSANFGMGHPEKVIDFAYRSEHEMTVAAKAVINAFYGSAPKFSYWNGCSAGGRQAMKMAQMFPADFDGIIAGAPGLDWSGRTSQAVRIAQVLQDEAARLPAAKTKVLHDAVMAACDEKDGLKDGLLQNPGACTFDPGALACKAGDEASCLTSKQVETARLIYSPIVDATSKREIPGLARGSELGWTDQGWSVSARATGLDHFRFLVYQDPQWDIQKFNAATDVAKLTEGPSGAIDARDPNLKPFFDRGGKLLQYHGWADPQITPLNSVAYYESVARTLGGAAKIHGNYRLFLAPAMGHCGGGAGPNEFDELTALEQWVEQGKAPDQLIATKSTNGKLERSRPLCAYPQIATYKGTGSIDEAASFVCK